MPWPVAHLASLCRLNRLIFQNVRLLHNAAFFRKPYFWSKAYAITTAGGGASLDTLQAYIDNQESPT